LSKKKSKHHGAIEPAEAGWSDLILLCGKCAGKLSGNKDARSALRHALKRAGRAKQVRIAETTCLDICPDDGIAACALDRAGQACGPVVLRPPFDGAALLRALVMGDEGSVERR
jgi:hypothetical protein